MSSVVATTGTTIVGTTATTFSGSLTFSTVVQSAGTAITASSSSVGGAGGAGGAGGIMTEKVGNAVFGYIQAVRSLDRTTVTTSEIASALSIPEASVISALPSLKVKGVKISK